MSAGSGRRQLGVLQLSKPVGQMTPEELDAVAARVEGIVGAQQPLRGNAAPPGVQGRTGLHTRPRSGAGAEADAAA